MTVLERGGKKTVECPGCGTEYARIGSHWSYPTSSCDYPPFTNRQLEIIKGLNMGDGCIREASGYACMRVGSTNLPFLEWLDDRFGPLSAGVRLDRDSETIAANNEGRGRWSDYDFKDLYLLALRSHPTFTKLRKQWYTDDGIRFPDDLELSPESLRMWYVSDGSINWQGEYPYIAIGCSNENRRPQFIEGVFSDIGFDIGYSSNCIRVPSYQREQFLEYIGDTIPGFEYKWAIDDHERYDELKP